MEDGRTRHRPALSESSFTWSEDRQDNTGEGARLGRDDPVPPWLCRPANWDWGQDCEHRALISNMLSRCENAKGPVSWAQ